jgi:rod shape-determining protein MreD
MQPTFSSSRILLPVRPWFIFLSLIAAAVLNFLPTAHWPGMPDWVALVLCFWSVREFRRVGMGWGFVLGLLMDVADGAVLGQHCFAYVLLLAVSPIRPHRYPGASCGSRSPNRPCRSCPCSSGPRWSRL